MKREKDPNKSRIKWLLITSFHLWNHSQRHIHHAIAKFVPILATTWLNMARAPEVNTAAMMRLFRRQNWFFLCFFLFSLDSQRTEALFHALSSSEMATQYLNVVLFCSGSERRDLAHGFFATWSFHVRSATQFLLGHSKRSLVFPTRNENIILTCQRARAKMRS